MRSIAILLSAALVVTVPAYADVSTDAVRSVVRAIQSKQDISVGNYAGAVSPADALALQSVAKCEPTNLMKQKSGNFTVVWNCISRNRASLGMQVAVVDGKVTSITTFQVEARPVGM